MLSRKSGWVDERGNIFIIYPIRQMAQDLNRSERTVKTALRELEDAGLLTRVHQGWNKANRLFLQLPEGQESAPPEGKACPLDRQKTAPSMGQNLPTSYTDRDYTDKIIRKAESPRCRYGEFRNVFLTRDELVALQTDFPDRYSQYIDRLSRYMAANNRHYASHCAVLRKWLDEDSRGAETYDYHCEEGDCL